ncbi:MAG: outer membrane beta-barrel protein [Candidatus Nitrotoga sp.]
MGKFKSGLAAAVLLVSVSGSAWATEVGQFYGAVDVGQGTLKDSCGGELPGETCDDTDVAFRGALGYQAHPNVAAEVSFAQYGKTKFNSPGVGNVEAKASGFQLAAIGSYPVADAFSVTGKLGLAITKGEIEVNVIGFGSASFDDSTTSLVWGIGGLYNINQSIAVRAQYESIDKVSFDSTDPTAEGDVNVLSAGVIFGF